MRELKLPPPAGPNSFAAVCQALFRYYLFVSLPALIPCPSIVSTAEKTPRTGVFACPTRRGRRYGRTGKPSAQEELCSEMEVVAELGGEDSWVVEVETADGDGVVEQNAVVGGVEDGDGEAEALA